MIRVLTVDDHAVVRAGVVGLLGSEEGILPVGAVGGCRAAITAFAELRPDVVVADFRLPDGDGLRLCRRMGREGAAGRVLLYSGFAGSELAVAAIVAGAGGVLGKGTAGELLIRSVRDVATGAMARPELPPEVVSGMAERLDPADLPVFGMRLAGRTSGEIAETLRTDRASVEARVDGIVDILKPRVDPPPLVAAAGGERRAERWL